MNSKTAVDTAAAQPSERAKQILGDRLRRIMKAIDDLEARTGFGGWYAEDIQETCDAIARDAGIKSYRYALAATPVAQPSAEPVAWLWTNRAGPSKHVQAFVTKPPPSMLRDPQCQPLYLHPAGAGEPTNCPECNGGPNTWKCTCDPMWRGAGEPTEQSADATRLAFLNSRDGHLYDMLRSITYSSLEGYRSWIDRGMSGAGAGEQPSEAPSMVPTGDALAQRVIEAQRALVPMHDSQVVAFDAWYLSHKQTGTEDEWRHLRLAFGAGVEWFVSSSGVALATPVTAVGGEPSDDDGPGYHTHWTLHPNPPKEPTA